MESKIEATDRLRREGRWSEASAFRDEEQQRLRADGFGHREATEASWHSMIDRFPALPKSAAFEAPSQPQSIDAFPEDFQGKSADLVRDIQWVYANLDQSSVVPADAPTSGAWHMLTWARAKRDRFFEVMLPKTIKAKPDDEADEEHDQKLIDLARTMEECVTSTCPHCGRQFRWEDERSPASYPILSEFLASLEGSDGDPSVPILNPPSGHSIG
jgi:hypothetical protein